MAINITKQTVDAIQTLVHDAFDTNATLDRIKTILATYLVYPNLSNIIHQLAHKYSLDIGDGIGDLIEMYNEPINYGDIPKHIEDYKNVQEAIDKVYEIVILYQNELNQGAKIAYENMDIHIYEGILNIIKQHNQYVEMVILIKDIVDKYGDKPSLDVNILKYNLLGEWLNDY